MQTLNSQYAYREVLKTYVDASTRLLDIGCGHTMVPEWMEDCVEFQRDLLATCRLARGCDPVDSKPHVAGLDKHVGRCDYLPYAPYLFNLVTANMVVEHIEDLPLFTNEVRRALAVGGKFIFHTPNLCHPLVFLAWLLPDAFVRQLASHLDGRAEDDVFCTRYRMNTRRAIASVPGFRVVSARCVPTGPLLRRVPVLRRIEALFMRFGPRWMQADWVVVLEKI